jgi:hypothetical protein
MSRHSKILLAVLFALVFGLAGSAQATSFSLGNISGPGVFSTGNSKDYGPFTDKVHFTIDPGVTLIFKATAIAYGWRHGGIPDFDGTLSDASGIIQNGDASAVYFPNPYPNYMVTFPDIVLGPGHYFVSLFGNSWLDVNSHNDYTIKVTFASTPLPASLLLMLTALGGFGLLGWRRFGKSADAPA